MIVERDSGGHILKASMSSDRARELARLSHEARRRRKQAKVDPMVSSILAALAPMPDGPEKALRDEIVRKSVAVAQGKSADSVAALKQLERMVKPKQVRKAYQVRGGRTEFEWVDAPEAPEPPASSAHPPVAPSSAARAKVNPCQEFVIGRDNRMPFIQRPGVRYFTR